MPFLTPGLIIAALAMAVWKARMAAEPVGSDSGMHWQDVGFSFWRIQTSKDVIQQIFDHIANSKNSSIFAFATEAIIPESQAWTHAFSQIIVLSPFGSLLPSVVFSDSFYQPPLVKLYWKRPICRPCRCKSLSKASCKGTWRVIRGAVQRTRTQSLLSCGCWEWDSSAWQLPCLSLSMYDIPSIRH